ncbi:MAG: phosphate ABC transporter ATP-binding protein [Planctomycetota bacterium]
MIRTESVSIHYKNKAAVCDATFWAPRGSITAIVGPSGCGKSSFLSALNRLTDLIPNASVSGQIVIDGVDVHHKTVDAVQLRRRVGMVFQSANPFPMSIQRNVQLALREHGVTDKRTLTDTTERALREVGLWDEVSHRLDTPATELSGGQQQRLCIARTLALEPEVLLMDEPCSALDPIAAARVEALIQKLRGKFTIVIVTHNLAQARRLADQMAVFWFRDQAGRIIEQGAAKDVFQSAKDPTAAAYLSGREG